MLERSQILVLSEIIEKIYGIEDNKEMRQAVLELIGAAVPYGQATYYLASTEKDHLLAEPVGVNILKEELQRYIDDYEDKDFARWIFMSGKSMVYRETDLFNDNIRCNETYYKDIYLPAKIYYSAQVTIAVGGKFMGVLSFYRSKETGDFSDEELFILEIIKNHLENKINIEIKMKGLEETKNKVYLDAYHFIENYQLTTREVEILGLLFAGLTNEVICSTLVISPNTLKKHNLSIYKKLGINSRWELINFMR